LPAVLLSALPRLAHAQFFPTRTTVQVRIGAFAATPLVTDAVSSRAVDDSIPGERSNEVTIKQQPGPIGTIALRMPLRSTTQLEINASVARSKVRGDDGLGEWDVANATVGNVVFGVGYQYRRIIALRAGVGITKLFVAERGLFTKGNSLKPLLEGGVSTGVIFAGRPFELDLRIQGHSYSTTTLLDDGGTGGNVARAVFQIGTNLWQAGR
jgi:hypothetical protein